jgi:hypothetical protein
MTDVANPNAMEWAGSSSAKFTTNRANVAGPKPNQDGKHPIFNMGGKVHLTQDRSESYKFKPMRT